MALRLFVRAAAISLLIGGLIAALSPFLEPAGNSASITQEPRWLPTLILFSLGNLLIGIGLIGLYLDQANQGGLPGLLVLIVAFTATIIAVTITMIEGFVYPGIARMPGAPQLLSAFTAPDGPIPLVGYLKPVMRAGFAPSYVLTGLLIIRSRRPSRAGGWALIAGSILSETVLLGPSAYVFAVAGMVLFGLALAWLGVALWNPPVSDPHAPRGEWA